MAKLTEKQKLFCEKYLITMNAVDAYLEVYKNCKSRDNASKHASRLLALPHIREYVDECLEEAHSNNVADVSRSHGIPHKSNATRNERICCRYSDKRTFRVC